MRLSAIHFSIRACFLLIVLCTGLSDTGNAQSVWSQCHKAGFAGDTNPCASDRPCFTNVFQDGSSIHVEWSGGQNYDLYHVIAGERGQRVGQAEVGGGRSGSYQINNVRPCATFVIKVQGCNTHFLGHADCSPWTETNFQAAPRRPSGFDTCLKGFVWRDAFPRDHACVTPDVRDQAAADNSQAAARRDPNGGPSGRDTCRQGFVWREAGPKDHVCVTPAVREKTRKDNDAKCSRLATCP
jgi:hypothetical protein